MGEITAGAVWGAAFWEALATFLILASAFFLVVGSLGLARLPGTMRRLHGPTKATTLGIGCMLIASMVYAMGVRGELSFHELLITFFLVLTAPVSAQMVAKAYILRAKKEREQLPPTGRASGWATISDLTNTRRRRYKAGFRPTGETKGPAE
ncbi:Na+/H+ antiporter subunit G [Xanthobacter sp. TB0139]|uniref:Na+/H+ antiporter subunit G n=1 Tax=Xanthobacter sp. TB0139 TaxID=3459178 RepID=UPI004039761B